MPTPSGERVLSARTMYADTVVQGRESVLSLTLARDGIGVIPESGLELSEEFAVFDARNRVSVRVSPVADLQRGCSCGAVMQGLLIQPECALFLR